MLTLQNKSSLFAERIQTYCRKSGSEGQGGVKTDHQKGENKISCPERIISFPNLVADLYSKFYSSFVQIQTMILPISSVLPM